MATDLDPIVDNWYRHLDKGQLFTVVAIDRGKRLVEIQHFDGDVEEIDFDGWYEMSLASAAEPEDWSGPVDNLEPDDSGYSETDMTDNDWRDSLRDNPRERSESWEDSSSPDERDEWGEGSMAEETLDPRDIEEGEFGSEEWEEEFRDEEE